MTPCSRWTVSCTTAWPTCPGSVALTSTLALTSSTLPYGLKIADLGLEEACRKNPDLKEGLNVYGSSITYPGVAKAFNLAYASPDTLL